MKSLYKSQKGQILVEYLLLMVIAIGCATFLTKQLVGRNENSPGMLIKAWDSLIKNIANDIPDCAEPTCK
ncbi:hypothetical protein K2P97_05780 [bacterium]|nr:hypothetical protein [bacterium]